MESKNKISEVPMGPNVGYEDFLLVEYNNLAQAFFKTKESISSFFKNYLVILSIPLPVFSLSYNYVVDGKVFEGGGIGQLLWMILPVFFVAVSIVGLFVMLYIIKLDINSKLYANSVNGIRRYFCELKECMVDVDLSMYMVLPREIKQPNANRFNSVIWIALAISFVNSLYMTLGLLLFFEVVSKWISGVVLAWMLTQMFVGYLYFNFLARQKS